MPLALWAKSSSSQARYPPDKQEKTTQTVLEQAEVLCHDWAA
jgi:type I restriction enzyme R subunit